MIIFNGLKENVLAANKIIRRLDLTEGAKNLAQELLSLPENWQVDWNWFVAEFKCGKNSVNRWHKELCDKEILKIDNKNNVEFLLKHFETILGNFTNLGKITILGNENKITNLGKNSTILGNFTNLGNIKKENLLDLNFNKKNKKHNTPAGVRACDTSIGEFSKPAETLENPHFERDFSENSAENSQVENQINENSAEFQNSNEILNENKSIFNQPLENSSENSQEFGEITGKNSQKAPLNLVGEN